LKGAEMREGTFNQKLFIFDSSIARAISTPLSVAPFQRCKGYFFIRVRDERSSCRIMCR
jgi:hypothetical protein